MVKTNYTVGQKVVIKGDPEIIGTVILNSPSSEMNGLINGRGGCKVRYQCQSGGLHEAWFKYNKIDAYYTPKQIATLEEAKKLDELNKTADAEREATSWYEDEKAKIDQVNAGGSTIIKGLNTAHTHDQASFG